MNDPDRDRTDPSTPVAEEWTDLGPAELTDGDMSEVPDEALPTDDRCPKCHWPVFQVTVIGPSTKVVGPCGCRVGTEP